MNPSAQPIDDEGANELLVRAATTAVFELGRDIAPLTRFDTYTIAVGAVRRAMLKASDHPVELREAILTQAARSALAEAKKWSGDNDRRERARSCVIAGLKRLPEQKQLVLSLWWEHDLNAREIAAVLSVPPAVISAEEAISLAAEAMEDLLGTLRERGGVTTGPGALR